MTPKIRGILTLMGSVFLLLQNAFSQNPAKLNFLFVLVDDLGYMDVGCNNPETFYETPNIDQLAKQGVRFTNAYAASPVCSPTRASILTGKYPSRLATTNYFGAPQPDTWNRNTPLLPASYVEHLPMDEFTLAKALQEAGYLTFFAGKWHLGQEGCWPENHGFDINRGGWSAGGPYGGNKYFSPYGNPRLEDGPEGEHLPDRLATETIQFIEDNADKPFFAYLSFYSVHTPIMGRKDLVEKYRKKKDLLSLSGPVWGNEGSRKLRMVQDHEVYAAMVEAMDLAIGRVLEKLDELDMAENTVVIFFSDNGGLSTSEGHPTSNLPLRAGKGWLYEGGIRVPMIIRWPLSIKGGIIEETPVISNDFYPTILEMAGLRQKSEQHVDGVSLVPLLNKGEIPDREALFWHYPHYGNQGGKPGAAVRKEGFKLIEYFGEETLELYDLSDDIGESKDLSSLMPEKVDELKLLLHKWLDETNARFPSKNIKFDPNSL